MSIQRFNHRLQDDTQRRTRCPCASGVGTSDFSRFLELYSCYNSKFSPRTVAVIFNMSKAMMEGNESNCVQVKIRKVQDMMKT